MFEAAYERLQDLVARNSALVLYAGVLLLAAWVGQTMGRGDTSPILLLSLLVGFLVFVREPTLALAAVFVAMVFGGNWTFRLAGMKLTSAKLLTAASFGAWAVRSFLDRRSFLTPMPATPAYMVLGGWMLLTSAMSIRPGEGMVQISTLLLLGGMCHLLYTMLDARRLVLLMNAVAVVSVAALVLGAMNTETRSDGVVRNANEWASVAMLLGFTTIGWLAGWRSRWRVPVLVLVLALTPFNVAQSASRAGILTFAIVSAGVVYLLRKERLVLGSSAIAAVAVIWMAGVDAAMIESRMEALAAADRHDGSLAVRADLLVHGVGLVREHPVFGVGLGMYPLYNAVLFPASNIRPFHNSYLTAAVEQGLVGLALHLAWWGLMGALLYRAMRHAPSARLRNAAGGLALALASFMLAMAAGDDLMKYALAHFLLGIGLAVERISREGGPLPPELQDGPRPVLAVPVARERVAEGTLAG